MLVLVKDGVAYSKSLFIDGHISYINNKHIIIENRPKSQELYWVTWGTLAGDSSGRTADHKRLYIWYGSS